MAEDFDYQRYLASREWAKKKEQIRERSAGACERCGVGKYESTHHITYANIGHEPLEDLLAVCNQCHAFLSAKSNHDPIKNIRLMVCAVDVDWMKDNMDTFSSGLASAGVMLVATLKSHEHVHWLEEVENLEFVQRLKYKP